MRRPICNLSLVLLIYRPTESVLCTHAYGTWYFYFIITIFFTCNRRLGKQIKNGHALPCTTAIEETETGFVDNNDSSIFFFIFPFLHQTHGCYTPFGSTVRHSLRRFAPHIPHDVYRQNLHWKRRRICAKEKKTTKKELSRSMKKLFEIKKIPIAFCLIYDLRTTDDSWMPSPPTRIILFFASKQVPFCYFFTRFVAYRCCTPKDRFFFHYYFPRHNSPRKYAHNVYTWADAMTLKTLRALSLP